MSTIAAGVALAFSFASVGAMIAACSWPGGFVPMLYAFSAYLGMPHLRRLSLRRGAAGDARRQRVR